jgi:hypothetical protein
MLNLRTLIGYGFPGAAVTAAVTHTPMPTREGWVGPIHATTGPVNQNQPRDPWRVAALYMRGDGGSEFEMAGEPVREVRVAPPSDSAKYTI